MKRRPRSGWLGPVAFTAALGLAAEGALRAAGFRYSHVPVGLRYVRTIAGLGGSQSFAGRSLSIRYAPDRELLWRPLPESGVTNSLGLLGPEWTPEPAPGKRRLIALGDSCTVAGDSPYPGQLSALAGPRGWEVLNAGVGSWSSYQGLRLLERSLLALKPDLVTIYFGWNDHWRAWAAPDKELSAILDRQWRLLAAVDRSRLLQALLLAATRLKGGASPRPGTGPRVPPEDYEANLLRMVALTRAAGAEAVLITAPSALTPSHPVTRVLFEDTHNIADPATIVELHSAYNARVRAVSRMTGAPLVDLAGEFGAEGNPASLFTDGIHLSPEGHRRLAARLDSLLAARGKMPHNIGGGAGRR